MTIAMVGVRVIVRGRTGTTGRLIAYADERGETGLQPYLASFFKEPLRTEERGLSRQFDRLRTYVDSHADGEQ